jgi:hypothetical protein
MVGVFLFYDKFVVSLLKIQSIFKKRRIMIYILSVLGVLVSLGLLIVVGEIFTKGFPDSKFSKWWRNNVVSECQECE